MAVQPAGMGRRRRGMGFMQRGDDLLGRPLGDAEHRSRVDGLVAGNQQELRHPAFGGDLGAPVVIPHLFNGRNNTFVFVSYEGMRERQALVFQDIVPTPAMRSVCVVGARPPRLCCTSRESSAATARYGCPDR